jgi:Tol biopolymer transport system component
MVHPDGNGLKRVSERGGWPVWWPDGTKIGMQEVGPDGNAEILVQTLATGETKVLAGLHFDGTNFPFDVSQDGKWLVTTNTQHGSDEIWLLEREKK